MNFVYLNWKKRICNADLSFCTACFLRNPPIIAFTTILAVHHERDAVVVPVRMAVSNGTGTVLAHPAVLLSVPSAARRLVSILFETTVLPLIFLPEAVTHGASPVMVYPVTE